MGTGHRCNERQTSDHSVLISARPHGLRQARIRDVSSSGLFVELPLSNSTYVELIFVRPAIQISRVLRIPALVVRTTQSGAGKPGSAISRRRMGASGPTKARGVSKESSLVAATRPIPASTTSARTSS
jgi:hypothetical protein